MSPTACDADAVAKRLREAAKANSAEKRRVSRGKAVLLPSQSRGEGGQGRILVLWATQNQVWEEDSEASSVLRKVLDSFQVDGIGQSQLE